MQLQVILRLHEEGGGGGESLKRPLEFQFLC